MLAASVYGFIQLIITDKAMNKSNAIGLLLYLTWLTVGAASTGLAMSRVALIDLSGKGLLQRKARAAPNTDRVTAGRRTQQTRNLAGLHRYPAPLDNLWVLVT